MIAKWQLRLPSGKSIRLGSRQATSRPVRLLCRWERHLAGFPHLGVVDRWLATSKRARIAR